MTSGVAVTTVDAMTEFGRSPTNERTTAEEIYDHFAQSHVKRSAVTRDNQQAPAAEWTVIGELDRATSVEEAEKHVGGRRRVVEGRVGRRRHGVRERNARSSAQPASVLGVVSTEQEAARAVGDATWSALHARLPHGRNGSRMIQLSALV